MTEAHSPLEEAIANFNNFFRQHFDTMSDELKMAGTLVQISLHALRFGEGAGSREIASRHFSTFAGLWRASQQELAANH